jgi:predicted transcriptional regulator
MRYNRERLEITHDILTIIRNTPGGAKPTHILFKANLSPALLNRYLGAMLEDNLIGREELRSRCLYTCTEKGVRLLDLLKSVDRMTNIINLSEKKRTRPVDPELATPRQ